MREDYIGRRRKGEMEWSKLSLIKDTRKSFFNGGEKGRGEREKVKLTLIAFGLRRKQHAHSIWYENLSYTTVK